jgi:hypothetical protein
VARTTNLISSLTELEVQEILGTDFLKQKISVFRHFEVEKQTGASK